ncbi:beta-N-acetylhexosaminidase [Gammaproteobacteria bacterium]|nr:beta-N-acetylhexosaminidase [Gammaproteobacteria bacterium]
MQKNLLGRLMLDLDSSSLTNEEKTLLQNPHVGGVILFSRNIVSKNQVLSLCHQIAEVNPNLLIAVDQEGGRVQRLIDGYAVLPSMQKLGKFVAQDKDNGLILASNLGWLMASEVIASGLDISFAPVLDLDLDRSSIIGDRSFGDTPKTVINIANSFINGMNEAGMEAVGKHFPGHGGIHADTHLSYSEDLRSLDDLKQHDLIPFHELHSRLGGIMTAHISFPEIDNNIATFSKYWLQSTLREKMRFKGEIFSDDLSMKGTDFIGGIDHKVQKALESGCTMILICNDRSAALQALRFMEKQSTSQSTTLSSLKASKIVSWEKLENDPRRKDIIKQIHNLDLEIA